MSLSLKRNPGEQVVITVPPSDVQRTIIVTMEHGYRIGFAAERDIEIHRAEPLRARDAGRAE